jgi:hypothetical protein
VTPLHFLHALITPSLSLFWTHVPSFRSRSRSRARRIHLCRTSNWRW